MTKKNKEPSKPEGEATDFIEGMQRVEAVAVLDKVLGMLKDPQCEMSSIIHVVQKAMVKVESKEDNKAFGEQDELWAKVIFEARHYNGTPHNLRALTEHFKKFYRIEKQTIL